MNLPRLQHGSGTWYWNAPKGSAHEHGHVRYEGQWQHGKRHGHGREYYFDGSLRREGEWGPALEARNRHEMRRLI